MSLPRRSKPRLVTLIALTALSTLSLNMFLPSLAHMAADFDADYALVSLSVAGYLAVTAIVQLAVGPLSDRIGRRPVLLAAMAVFVGASIGCVLAQDVWTFLVFRMLQSGMAAGYVLSQAIVRDTTSEREAAGLIGYISMAMALAPMLGPMLGGVLDTAFGWRASFVVYALAGAALWAWCWIDLMETRAPQSTSKPQVRRHDLLRLPLFWAYAMCTAFSTGAFYIFLTGAPLVAQAVYGVSTAQLGFYIGTITAGFMLGGFVSGQLARHVAPIKMMLAGRIVGLAGLSAGLIGLMSGPVSPAAFFGCTIFVGLGNGLTMPSSNASAMSIRPEWAGSAAGLNGASTVAVGAVLTSATGVFLTFGNPAQGLLIMMLGAVLLSLGAVLVAMRLDPK